MEIEQILAIILIIVTLIWIVWYIKEWNYDAAFEAAYQIVLLIYIIILLK